LTKRRGNRERFSTESLRRSTHSVHVFTDDYSARSTLCGKSVPLLSIHTPDGRHAILSWTESRERGNITRQEEEVSDKPSCLHEYVCGFPGVSGSNDYSHELFALVLKRRLQSYCECVVGHIGHSALKWSFAAFRAELPGIAHREINYSV
jgi:hypothetical protein